MRGADYCGYCAAKDEKFFGWRLHLVCTPDGLPAAFEFLPAAYHDLTPLHELTVELPSCARVFADKTAKGRLRGCTRIRVKLAV